MIKDVVLCIECKYAHLTTNGDCKYCDKFMDDMMYYELHLPKDFYCAFGERKESESKDDTEDGCMKEASEGEWIVHYNDIFPVESTEECSICHAEQYINGNDDNYCPNCGAKMKQGS